MSKEYRYETQVTLVVILGEIRKGFKLLTQWTFDVDKYNENGSFGTKTKYVTYKKSVNCG